MPNTWFVDGTNGSASNGGTSPEDAINTVNAGEGLTSDGDTLLIAAGTYTELVTVATDIHVAPLGNGDVIIESSGTGSTLTVTGEASFTDLTFIAPTSGSNIACSITGSRSRFSGCIFDRTSGTGTGALINLGAGMTDGELVDCTFRNSGGAGISIGNADYCLISMCRVYDPADDGIAVVSGSDDNTIQDCVIRNSGSGVAVDDDGNSNSIIRLTSEDSVESQASTQIHGGLLTDGSGNLADNTITATTMAADSITATVIAADAIGASEIADNAIDAGAIAASAITAAKIATDAIDADALAADAIAEINATVDTALSDIKLDHLVAVADSDDPVDNSIIAKLASTTGDWSTFVSSTDALQAATDRFIAATSEPSAPAITASMIDKLNWIATFYINKLTETATTYTVRNAADDANLATAAVSDDGTTATRGAIS